MDSHGLQAAYVLHARRYGESSLLLELLAREQGRLACIAKGVMGRRRGAQAPQVFQAIQVGLRGRGEVLTLAGVETTTPPLALAGRRLFCGLYVNELLLRLTARQDPLPGLFDDYAGALQGLAGTPPVDDVLRRFEMQLLTHLGLGLQLERDNAGEAIDPGCRYTVGADSGVTAVGSACADAYQGSTLEALRRGEFDDPATVREARALMRQIINHHLDGKPLRSRELFR